MNKKHLFGLTLMAAFVALLFMSFGNQVQGYMNFNQALESGSTGNVVGTWVEDRHFKYDQDRNIFTFFMADDTGAIREVVYHDQKPANFEDAEKVVVEGHFRNDTFVAEHILVKCPSKYNQERGPQAAVSAL